MKTLADRVWYAYHCLPRTGRQRKPPSYRSLEIKYGLSNGMLGRLMIGERKPEPETLVALSMMFGVSLDWLLTGKGEAPIADDPVPPRLPYLLKDGAKDPANAMSKATTLLWMAVHEKPDASELELLSHALSIGLRPK